MFNYENKVLSYFETNETSDISKEFDTLFKSACVHLKSFRHIKDYFIGLNHSIYSIIYRRPICKMNLFKKRNYFNLSIEQTRDLDSLYLVFKDMINYYKSLKDTNKESCSHPVIIDTIEYIHNNLDRDLNLENVSKNVHVSKNYLSCLFRQYVGLSFSDYINKLRIEKSKKLLTTTGLSLLDIALECGFNSQSYFCSVFKKFENISPKKFQYLKLNETENQKGAIG